MSLHSSQSTKSAFATRGRSYLLAVTAKRQGASSESS